MCLISVIKDRSNPLAGNNNLTSFSEIYARAAYTWNPTVQCALPTSAWAGGCANWSLRPTACGWRTPTLPPSAGAARNPTYSAWVWSLSPLWLGDVWRTSYLCWEKRVNAQTIYFPENLAFCFQLCTVAHFVGFLPLPWFSCSLVFFPYK